MTLDILAQLGIMCFGLSAIWLVGCRTEAWKRWGYIAGMCGQPFWLYTTLAHEQYGIAAMTAVYAFMWGRGIWNHWVKPHAAPTGAIR